MTEADDKNLSPALPRSPQTAKPARSGMQKILISAGCVILIVIGLLAAIYRMQTQGHIMPLSGVMANSAQSVAALEYKVQALDSRLTDLAARVDSIAAAPVTPGSADTSKAPKISGADLAHLQDSLTALAATVSALKFEAASSQAESIAFVQLRDAAMSGHGFAHGLEVFEEAAKSDPGFKELFAKLMPIADKGAPMPAGLREQLVGQSAAIDEAIAKAGAQTWWERVLVELKGLISIRPLHGAASADVTLDTMQEALARGDLGPALDEFKNLPPEAQKTLDDWHRQVEARRMIDETLQAIADRLITGASAEPAAQDTP